MKIVHLFLRGILVSLLAILPAHALYTGFLRDAPIYYFTQQDSEMSEATLFKALSDAKDGQKLKWHNPQSGAYGYALPSNTQANCRHLEIFNSAKGVTARTQYEFCKIEGKWRLVQ